MVLLSTIALVASLSTAPELSTGFQIPHPHKEFSTQYKQVNNLIVIRVVINDSIVANLILDTGCRNVVLFGKRFSKSIPHFTKRTVRFSGLGSGGPVSGFLAIGNTISMGKMAGINMPIVVVPEKNLFNGSLQKIDGVIGNDLFSRFEVEINPQSKLVTFRMPESNQPHDGFISMPVKIVNGKPVIHSLLNLGGDEYAFKIVVDTGSMFELLINSTDTRSHLTQPKEAVGKGFNGIIQGVETRADKVSLPGLSLSNIGAVLVHSKWHDYGSIGMAILKDYIIVINYHLEKIHLKEI
jgi:hypothetical protein